MFSIFSKGIATLRYAMLSLCALLSLNIGKAQQANEPMQDIRNQVAHVIQPLNKAQIPTGYLYEYGHLLYDPENYQGTLTDSNYVQPAQWQAVYGAVYASHLYGAQALPHPTAVQSQQASYDEAHEPIALAVLLSKFSHIRLDAVQAGLLSEYAGQYYDVPNRPQSPYLQRENLLIAPTQETRIGLTIPFVLPSALYYSNYLTTAQIQSVQVDFDNGQGYQTIAWNQTYSISYPTSGLKTLKYRLTLVGGMVREGHSFLGIKPESNVAQRYQNVESDSIIVAETDTKGGGRASIVYSVKNTTGKLRKPFIVVEGFDQSKIAPQVKEKDNDLNWFLKLIDVRVDDINYPNRKFLSELFDDESEYDLVFLNFKDGTADIRKNSECFMEVVRKVNEKKALAGSTHQNVVLGLSMGGLVTRYGLAKMIKVHNENPQVRVLASYDSPHRGANIPLGFQAMMHQLNELHLLPFLKLGAIQPRVPQAVATIRSPAAQQMLLQQATNGNDGTSPNTFIEGEYRQMVTGFVMPYKFITLSAGAECAQRSHEPNAMLMDTNLEFGLFKGMANFFLADNEYIAEHPEVLEAIQNAFLRFDKWWFYWRFEMKVRALPMPNGGGTNEVSHFKVYTKMPILGKIQVVPVIGQILGAVALVLEYVPTSNKKFNSPAYTFLDGVAGGTLLSKDVLPLGSIGLGSAHYPTQSVCFIPVPSALDILPTAENVSKAYNSGYLGTNGGGSQVQKFLSQEYSFNSVGGYWSHNREHDASPTARMALWMYREIENQAQSNADVCERACPPNVRGSINVPGSVCPLPRRFPSPIWNDIVFNNPDGLAYTWVVSGNLQVRQDNNGIWQVSAVAGGSGEAWIELWVQTQVGCSIRAFQQPIWIGLPATPTGPIWVNWSLPTNSSPTLLVCPNEWVGFNLVNAPPLGFQGITHYEWAFTCGTIDNTVNNGLVGMTAQIYNGEAACGHVAVRAVNACGASAWLIVDTEYGGNCNNLFSMRQNTEVFSNPADTETNVQIKNLPNVNYSQNNENTPAGFAYQIEVYNHQGNLVKTLQTDKVRQKVVTSDLPKGHYQVIVKRGDLVVSKHLIVNR